MIVLLQQQQHGNNAKREQPATTAKYTATAAATATAGNTTSVCRAVSAGEDLGKGTDGWVSVHVCAFHTLDPFLVGVKGHAAVCVCFNVRYSIYRCNSAMQQTCFCVPASSFFVATFRGELLSQKSHFCKTMEENQQITKKIETKNFYNFFFWKFIKNSWGNASIWGWIFWNAEKVCF